MEQDDDEVFPFLLQIARYLVSAATSKHQRRECTAFVLLGLSWTSALEGDKASCTAGEVQDQRG